MRMLTLLVMKGRGIKNVLRTADAFARSEGQPLSVKHLVEVLQVMADEKLMPVVEELGKLLTKN